MKDKKNLFDLNPPEGHVARVERAVDGLLMQMRTEERRKKFAWLLVPAFASFFGFYVWKRKTISANHLMAEHDFLIELEGEAELDLIADLELIEEIENMEDWDGTEET